MHTTTHYPLRRVVGAAIPIAGAYKEPPDIRVVGQSEAARRAGFSYEFELRSGLAEAREDPRYGRYFPRFRMASGLHQPAAGMDTAEPPAGAPFPPSASFLSLFAWPAAEGDAAQSTHCSVDLLVRLARPALLGGVCFAGLDSLPVVEDGRGGFGGGYGLPGEVRVTPLGAASTATSRAALSDFLDFDVSVTRQVLNPHAGWHYLLCDPTWTGQLLVHLGDFPVFTGEVRPGEPPELGERRRGFVIPYFYPFAYEESARYRPTVPGAALLARGPIKREHPSSATEAVNAVASEYTVFMADGPDAGYASFPPAAMFNGVRRYSLPGQDGAYSACFISDPVAPDESVEIILAQTEEHPRCLAGLRMLVPFTPRVGFEEDLEQLSRQLADAGEEIDLGALAEIPPEALDATLRLVFGLPGEVNFCERMRIEVFELDPPEGAGPADIGLDSRFARRIADRTIDELDELLDVLLFSGVRFSPPTSARHLALRLTNRTRETAQFVIRNARLIQSAHVWVQPRLSRRQHVQALHYRIIGEGVADDYSALGAEGFNFSVEHLRGGEPRATYLAASTFLDLAQHSGARLYANPRRRAVEIEKSDFGPAVNALAGDYTADFEQRTVGHRTAGWRTSESGAGVAAKAAQHGWAGANAPPGDFSARQTQEVRAHTEHLYPTKHRFGFYRPPFGTLRDWFNAAGYFEGYTHPADPNGPHVPTSPRRLDSDNFPWTGLGAAPEVEGLAIISASPPAIQEWGSYGDFLINPSLDTLLTARFSTMASTSPAFGGLSSSVSVGAGFIANGSVSFGMAAFPMYNLSATFGSQGAITRQSVRTGYSVQSSYDRGFSDGTVETTLWAGSSKRRVVRRAVPDTDTDRIRDAAVIWQGRARDIVVGTIPLDLQLPGLATRFHYRSADEAVRVRFGSGVSPDLSVDVWFDVREEQVGDDQ